MYPMMGSPSAVLTRPSSIPACSGQLATLEREGEQGRPVDRSRRLHADSSELGLHELEPGPTVLGDVTAFLVGHGLEQV